MRLVDGNADIWIEHLPDGPLERLTSDDGIDASPFWSPDGAFVGYTRDSDIWQRRADGTGSPELVLDDERRLSEGLWSPDGEWMILRTDSEEGVGPDNDILGFRPGVDSAAIPLVASPEFSELSPALSPNGRWLAYTSDRTGQREVYVRPFPNVDSTRVTVSRAGGLTPLWAHSGSELFFFDAEGGFVAAEVVADSVFRVLRSETLFNAESELYSFGEGVRQYANGPDDEQFLMLSGLGAVAAFSGDSGDTRFILVQNWFEVLRQRMGN
jgi:Tol biopolymer transport system component